MRLKGRIAIVTGSARGVGKACAIALAKEGAKVAINDIDQEAIDKAVEEIKTLGRECIGIVADVSNEEQVKDMVEKVIDEWGRIDILVNNAGGALHTPARLEDVTEKDWDRVINVNLKGTFFCCKAVIPHMIKQDGGRIINMSALAGRWRASLAGVQYTSAKAGVGGLTRHLANEFGPYGIYVNAVAPTITLSGPRVEALWNTKSEEEKKKILSSIPLRRLGRPEDIANVVVFLASDEASFITGATIDVNGGRFMF